MDYFDWRDRQDAERERDEKARARRIEFLRRWHENLVNGIYEAPTSDQLRDIP